MSTTEQSAARYQRGVRMLVCRDCNKCWEWSKDEQAFFKSKGWRPPARCHECRNLNRELKKAFEETFEPGPDQKLTCVGCGVEFIWNEEQQIYYKERGFMPPKRCLKCRGAHKKTVLKRAHRAPAFTTLGDAIRRNLGGAS